MISEANSETRRRDYISYSAISTFRSCPLKYKFRYIDGLDADTVSSSLIFGTAIHAAIEEYFRAKMAGDTLPSQSEMLDVYHQTWQAADIANVQLGKTESLEGLALLAGKIITAFLASDLASLDGQILGVEEELRGKLIDGVPDLLGRVDLLLETSDTVSVVDFKTARAAWTLDQASDNSEQLMLYCDLVRRLVPGKSLRLKYVVFTKTKDPAVQLIDLPFREEQLDRTKTAIKAIWAAIETGNFYPVPSIMNCPGCGYRQQCAVWPKPAV
jgi:putative RecB family exonuclease